MDFPARHDRCLGSIPVVAYGTHLKVTSPQSAEHSRIVAERIRAENPGRYLGPGIGIGLALAGAWPFVAGCECVLAAFVTAGLLGVRPVEARRPGGGVILAALLGLGCTWVATGVYAQAGSNFEWGHYVLGSANLLSATGYGLASVTAVAMGVNAAKGGSSFSPPTEQGAPRA